MYVERGTIQTPNPQPAAFALQQLLHPAGGPPLAVIGIGFVVLLDIVEAVEIVDHDPGGFAQSLWREIAEPADPLQPRAVAEVEAGDRIDQPPLWRASFQEIMRRQRLQHRA